MKLFPRGGFWWVDATLEDKRRIRKSTGIEVKDDRSKRKAEDAAERIVSEAGGPGTVTLRQALAHTYETHWSRTRSAQAMHHMVNVLSRQLGHHDVKHVSYGVLKDYADALLRDGLAPATVNRRMTAIGVALRDQVRRGVLKARPELPHFAENNTKERYMQPDEEAAALSYLARKQEACTVMLDHERAAEWGYVHALAVFLLDTGFRFSEAYKFDASGGMATLRHGETKNSKGRSVPMTDRACLAAGIILSSPVHERLAAALALQPESKSPWDWVDHRWKQATKDAGCPDVTLHTLRHTCASRLVQRGVSLYLVAKWMGHSSIKITERYAHLAPDALSQALAALQGRPVRERLHGTRSSPQRNDSTDQRHIAEG